MKIGAILILIVLVVIACGCTTRDITLPGSGAVPPTTVAGTPSGSGEQTSSTPIQTRSLNEQPYINIIPVTQKRAGDMFIVQGTTNLAVGEEILVEVYSSSFGPAPKSSSEFTGSSGIVEVVQGSQGVNTWTFPVDTYLMPDEYRIKASAFGLQTSQNVTATTLFNVGG